MEEEEYEENEEYERVCKIVIIGETGVGKTCIMIRFVQNRFNKNQLSTIGASFAEKEIKLRKDDKEEKIKFNLWDTTGQEKYRALTRNFYAGAKAAILVYDITQLESFEKIRDFWVKELREHCEKNIILALAANKYDNFMEERVDEKEAKQLADDNNMIFARTSALSGEGINDLFIDIGNKYLNNFMNEEAKKVSKTQNIVENGEKKVKKKKNKSIKLNRSKGSKGNHKKKKKNCC